MDSQFQRILRLARRTGDRLIVTDPEGEEPCVVMGLEAFEVMLDHADVFADEFPDEFEDSSWTPEKDGDLVSLSQDIDENNNDHFSDDLKRAVDQDLHIIESWQKEKKETEQIQVDQAEKKDENKANFSGNEEQFYLEPIE